MTNEATMYSTVQNKIKWMKVLQSILKVAISISKKGGDIKLLVSYDSAELSANFDTILYIKIICVWRQIFLKPCDKRSGCQQNKECCIVVGL